MMLPLFDVIFVSDSSEVAILLTYLEFRGISVSHTKEKYWKEEKSQILLFSKFSLTLAEELLDFQKSILLFGSFESEKTFSYLEKGVSQVWEHGTRALFSLPLFQRKDSAWSWIVHTKTNLFDIQIQHLLRAFGHQCYIETDFSHFMNRLLSMPAEMAILDWDILGKDLSDSVNTLKAFKEKRQTQFLGIKDFEKDNLYRELSYGIQAISPLLFRKSELISVLLNSFGDWEPKEEITPNTKRIQKIQFELQEKNKPIRLQLTEETEILPEFQDLKQVWGLDYYRELFKFLPLLFVKH